MIFIFELIALIISLTGIGTLARGKGANPYLTGGVAFAGWWFLHVGIGLLVHSDGIRYLLILLAWAWVAVVAGFLRFVLGVGRPKPDSKWNCSNCRYLNNASSVVCEACQQPWQPPA